MYYFWIKNRLKSRPAFKITCEITCAKSAKCLGAVLDENLSGNDMANNNIILLNDNHSCLAKLQTFIRKYILAINNYCPQLYTVNKVYIIPHLNT
jgi:hypothetical protein